MAIREKKAKYLFEQRRQQLEKKILDTTGLYNIFQKQFDFFFTTKTTLGTGRQQLEKNNFRHYRPIRERKLNIFF